MPTSALSAFYVRVVKLLGLDWTFHPLQPVRPAAQEKSVWSGGSSDRIKRMTSRRQHAISLAATSINRSAMTAVAMLILSFFAQAQMNTAEISGVVEDASGAVIPGAGVAASRHHC